MNTDELERELRAERPRAETEFTSRLDEWAAEGFPHERGLGPRALGSGSVAGPGRLERAWQRLTDSSPRRMLLPLGAAATVMVIVGIVVGQGGMDASQSGGGEFATSPGVAKDEDGSAGGDAASAESSVAAPALEGATGTAQQPDALTEPPADSIGRAADERIVDATARITLGAERGEVQEVANGVVAVTDRYAGVVRNSQVTTDQGGARASFELEIPYRDLDAAITDISELADVISRTESAEDITARAVRSQRRLARVLEQIRMARIERIEADTHEQRLVIDARIDSLEATANSLEAEIDGVVRQGRFATVNVEITSNGPESGSGGGWTISDALDDAGRALELIAGIALVTLAIAAPLAVIGVLAWLITARARRVSRERALE